MRLKRGLVRESCDLCHRRKIKCDRAVRMAHGHDGCSQCGIRQTVCSVDDSNDVRLRRQKQQGTLSGHSDRTQGRVTSRSDSPSNAPTSSQDARPVPEPSHGFFDLNPDSIFFLDQVFMGDLALPDFDGQLMDLGHHFNEPPAGEGPAVAAGGDHGHGQPQPQLISSKDLWTCCDMNETTFISALHAYFEFAALALPVLLRDAFRKGYESGQSSDALIYAVACRGMPFLQLEYKWEMQQRLARRFREAFFERQKGSSPGHSNLRLDDVEALALMASFPYQEAAAASQFSHLESLFLSHDSLVLATLQCRLRGAGSEPADSPSQSTERLTLLFWHVYGLDAFHSLDHKSISRIPENEADTETPLPQSDAAGYLDAILGLAVVARQIFRLLGSASARHHGVRSNDVDTLYGHIQSWRRKSCPAYLKRPVGANGEILTQVRDMPILPEQHCQLQRAVLWLLEINCYMQIESFVNQHGIRAAGTALEDTFVGVRVRHETLLAVQEAARIVRWMNMNQCTNGEACRTKFSLADLSPNIVRDICAGLSYWTCTDAKRPSHQDGMFGSPYRLVVKRERQRENLDREWCSQSQHLLDISRRFRDVAASAASHHDTESVLQRLNEHITSVEQDVQNALLD